LQEESAVSISTSSLPFAADQVIRPSLLSPTITATVDASDTQTKAVGVLARIQGNGSAYVGVLTQSGMAQILLLNGASGTFKVLASEFVGTNAGVLTFAVTGTGTSTTLLLTVNSSPPLILANSRQTTLDSAGGVGLFAWETNGIIDKFSVSGT
jgi:hypothetical protein